MALAENNSLQFVFWEPPAPTPTLSCTSAGAGAVAAPDCVRHAEPRSKARKRRKEIRLRYNRQETGLLRLPYDVLLETFLYLDTRDVLTMKLVSQACYDVTNCYVLWKNLAYKQLLRARPLHLKEFQHPANLSFRELRRAVMSVNSLENNWNQPWPLRAYQPKVIQLEMMRLDCFCYAMKFASRYLLLPTRDGFLIGWDMERNLCVGRYGMSSEIGHRSILINVRAEYDQRSLYCIVGKVMSPYPHGEMQFSVLHIQFPENGNNEATNKLDFTSLAQFPMPRCRVIELHILDAKRRMIGVLFLCPETNTIGLYIIFDWETGLTAMTNTGLPFKYRRTVIGLRLSADGNSVVAHSELDGIEVFRTFSLAALRAARGGAVGTWRPMLLPTYPVLPHVQKESGNFRWGAGPEDASVAGMTPMRVWTLRQWWPTFDGVPDRNSKIVLYMHQVENRTFWRVAQYYSTPNGPCAPTECECMEPVPSSAPAADKDAKADTNTSPTPDEESATTETQPTPPLPQLQRARHDRLLHPRRFVLDLPNPLLMPFGDPGLPIVAISFNHIGWIELVPCARQRKRKRKVLKMATFPDPGTCPSMGLAARRARVKTLDVPPRVLAKACHLIIDSTTGSIMVTTTTNELHVYQYV